MITKGKKAGGAAKKQSKEDKAAAKKRDAAGKKVKKARNIIDKFADSGDWKAVLKKTLDTASNELTTDTMELDMTNEDDLMVLAEVKKFDGVLQKLAPLAGAIEAKSTDDLWWDPERAGTLLIAAYDSHVDVHLNCAEYIVKRKLSMVLGDAQALGEILDVKSPQAASARLLAYKGSPAKVQEVVEGLFLYAFMAYLQEVQAQKKTNQEKRSEIITHLATFLLTGASLGEDLRGDLADLRVLLAHECQSADALIRVLKKFGPGTTSTIARTLHVIDCLIEAQRDANKRVNERSQEDRKQVALLEMADKGAAWPLSYEAPLSTETIKMLGDAKIHLKEVSSSVSRDFIAAHGEKIESMDAKIKATVANVKAHFLKGFENAGKQALAEILKNVMAIKKGNAEDAEKVMNDMRKVLEDRTRPMSNSNLSFGILVTPMHFEGYHARVPSIGVPSPRLGDPLRVP